MHTEQKPGVFKVPVDIVTDTLRRVYLQYMWCISKVKGEKLILNILKQKINRESYYLFKLIKMSFVLRF